MMNIFKCKVWMMDGHSMRKLNYFCILMFEIFDMQ